MTIQQAYTPADPENNTINASEAHRRGWHATRYLRSAEKKSGAGKTSKSSSSFSKCPFCHTEVQPSFKFCPGCGRPKDQTKKTTRATKGLGYVYRRGQTWSICLTVHSHRSEKGGFSSKKEAQAYASILKQAIETSIEAKKRGPKNDCDGILFSELYNKMMEREKARIGASTLGNYKAAYNYYSDIYDIPFSDLNTEDFQICIDDCPCGSRTKENMKALGTKLYKLANELRIFGVATSTDFAKFVWIDRSDKGTRNPFLEEDLIKLRAAVQSKIPNAEIIYTMCATGFRPSEFLSLKHNSYNPNLQTLQGGAKTEAGKNRIVPVHPLVLPFVQRAYTSGNEFLFNPEGFSLEHFREKIFYPCLEESGIQKISKNPRLTPYSTRHTFATLMKSVPGASIDKAALMGHTSYTMTQHYQHEDYKSLASIIEAIPI